MGETRVPSLDWEHPLEKEMATHSNILAWETPWTEKLGRLQSVGLQESDLTLLLSIHACYKAVHLFNLFSFEKLLKCLYLKFLLRYSWFAM